MRGLGLCSVRHPSEYGSSPRFISKGAMEGPTVITDGNKIFYRASALGTCTKALTALRLGYEPLTPPERDQTRMNEGHLHEQQVLSRLKDMGWSIQAAQDEVVLKVSGNIYVVGHIDAKGYQADRGYVVEVKSQSQNEWEKFNHLGWDSGFFPKYKWQVSSYMLATGLGLAMVRKNRNSGEIKINYHYQPFYTIEDIRRRLLDVEAYARMGTLPEMGCSDFFCPVSYLDTREERVEISNDELETLAKQYRQALADEKAVAEKKKITREAIFDQLTITESAGAKVVTRNNIKITAFYANNPPMFDAELMKNDGLDPEKYKKQTRSLRLKVTVPEQDEQ